MNDLRIRQTSFGEGDYASQISSLRSRIDILDDELLELLKKRMLLSDEIGKLKKANNVAILQNTRWHEILGKMILEGEKYNLSEEFVIKIFKAIHQESINRQEKIVKGK
jgi:dahp synthetase I family protein